MAAKKESSGRDGELDHIPLLKVRTDLVQNALLCTSATRMILTLTSKAKELTKAAKGAVTATVTILPNTANKV